MAKVSLQEEFVQLIATQQKLIHSLYFALPEDRKDMFQEIVLQLWKSYPSFNRQAKVSTQIYRIAPNTVFAKLRKEKGGPENESYSEHAYQISEPETTFEVMPATEELYRAIAQLSDVDKAVILLYLEEHTYDEKNLPLNMGQWLSIPAIITGVLLLVFAVKVPLTPGSIHSIPGTP